MKFRNVRVKMKGGKTRIQRAMVLASGKLRFVKNISRSSPRRARHTKPKIRRITNLARRKHRGGGKSLIRSVGKLVRGGALIAPAVQVVVSGQYARGDMIPEILYRYSGYSLNEKRFDWGHLAQGWGPFAGASLVTYGIPKLISLIRRL